MIINELYDNFNPIIVLFLTIKAFVYCFCNITFQSYYSLIFNIAFLNQRAYLYYFNPIIVLFLTRKQLVSFSVMGHFNPIIVLFLTLVYPDSIKVTVIISILL